MSPRSLALRSIHHMPVHTASNVLCQQHPMCSKSTDPNRRRPQRCDSDELLSVQPKRVTSRAVTYPCCGPQHATRPWRPQLNGTWLPLHNNMSVVFAPISINIHNRPNMQPRRVDASTASNDSWLRTNSMISSFDTAYGDESEPPTAAAAAAAAGATRLPSWRKGQQDPPPRRSVCARSDLSPTGRHTTCRTTTTCKKHEVVKAGHCVVVFFFAKVAQTENAAPGDARAPPRPAYP